MRVSLCVYCGQPTNGVQVCQNCTQHTMTPAAPAALPTTSYDSWSDETHPNDSSMVEFTSDSLLVIQVKVNNGAFLVVRLHSSATVGRSDESQMAVPTVDFAKHHGLEYGVSRMHARLERSDNMVILSDLGSRNGTYINQQWCRPHSEYIIRDQDEIMFGRLKTRVHFRSEAMIRRAVTAHHS
jgi:transcription elongation factor Elf1